MRDRNRIKIIFEWGFCCIEFELSISWLLGTFIWILFESKRVEWELFRKWSNPNRDFLIRFGLCSKTVWVYHQILHRLIRVFWKSENGLICVLIRPRPFENYKIDFSSRILSITINVHHWEEYVINDKVIHMFYIIILFLLTLEVFVSYFYAIRYLN
jgi:hypothetical protein